MILLSVPRNTIISSGTTITLLLLNVFIHFVIIDSGYCPANRKNFQNDVWIMADFQLQPGFNCEFYFFFLIFLFDNYLPDDLHTRYKMTITMFALFKITM